MLNPIYKISLRFNFKISASHFFSINFVLTLIIIKYREKRPNPIIIKDKGINIWLSIEGPSNFSILEG
jgi:hypothetical protein